jgi:diguanylate cyclase (GGDEF)-like protein
MTASPQLAAWRGLTRKICLKSGIALPLRGKDGVLGALVIYAEEDAFDDDEVKLLEELANDLAYGIQALREIQARERYEAQLAYQANYDPTTGVANRNLFRDRVDQALLHAARTGTMAATIKLGLDRFGAINDSLGHTAGDELLKHIAQRIGACVHQDDTLARLDGDKFGIAINEMHSEEDVSPIARRLIDAIMQPIVLNGVEIFPSVSMGISIFPRDGENTDRQLQNSRAAMENAKSLGGGQFRYYAPDMNERATARLSLEADLRRALERHEFVLHYQPKASLKNGRLTGAEALVRWQHPTRGRVMPGEFIALAEETGLIEPLGRWVIEQVCTQLHSWCNEGLPVPTVSVNLSARQFRQEDLADFIRDTLRRHDVEPQLLEVELTESTVMHDVDAGIAVLRRLKGIGVKCSLDDFGTGHSSLSYLKRLPIDHLKIDQSFVRDITTDPDNAALCIAIIGLAHSLKLTVVAEGVETPGQMNYLRTHDCDELQGHLFGCAMPAEEFARLLACGRSLALPTTGGSAGTLLIVDDESNILSALRRALRLAGMRILTAGSALEAFEILATNDVQVVISDQRMPQMNGIEFLSRVRDLYPDTVRMVLSGYTDVDSILESINRGTVFRFLTKPWDDALLLEHIDDAFRYHRVASKRQSARATTDNPPLGARPVGDAVSQTGWSPTLVRSDRGDKQQCG